VGLERLCLFDLSLVPVLVILPRSWTVRFETPAYHVFRRCRLSLPLCPTATVREWYVCSSFHRMCEQHPQTRQTHRSKIAGPAFIRSTAFVQIACRSLSWNEYDPRAGGVASTRSCSRGIYLRIVALNQIDQSSVKYMVTSCHLSNYSDVCPHSCHDLTFTTPFEEC
jgi:hypothetical protein